MRLFVVVSAAVATILPAAAADLSALRSQVRWQELAAIDSLITEGECDIAVAGARELARQVEARQGPRYVGLAEIHAAIGRALRRQSRFDDAIAALGKALELWHHNLGEVSAPTLFSLRDMAAVHREAGRLDEAGRAGSRPGAAGSGPMRMSPGRRVPAMFVVAVLTAIPFVVASRPAVADEPTGKPPPPKAAAQKTEPQKTEPQATKPATIPLPRKRLHLLPRRVSDKQPEGRPAHCGLLASELARQAVLIAARDELGLPTRDALLGDAIAKNDPDAVSVTTMVDPGGRFAVLLGPDRQSPRQFEPLNRVFTFAEAGGLVNYAELSAKLEHLSRELFPEFLEQSGFARLPSAPQAGAGAVDATTARLLTRFSPMAQLTAVRRLHAIRAASVRSGPGQSADVLEALAEGYANLAMLAQQVWSEQPVV